MKIQIEISDRLYAKVGIAAKSLNLSKKQFLIKAIRKLVLQNQVPRKSESEFISQINKFLEENPEANIPWWTDRSWDEFQPSRKVNEK
jgi:hypothetical protein